MWLPIFTGTSLAIASNWLKQGHMPNLELTPNCLLTRYPLVFISGPRSLFYFRHYWNSGPGALAEHGYDVHTLILSRLAPELQAEQIVRTLNGEKVHVLADSSCAPVLEALSKLESPVQSLTLLAGPSYKPPAHWHLKALKGEAKPHVITLAEQLRGFHVSLWLSRLSLTLHNASRRVRGLAPVEAAAVGLVSDQKGFVRELLKVSISLAEHDLSVMT